MLVGKSDVNVLELEKRVNDLEKFIAYSDSLVPDEFKHITSIVNNQRYLCCLLLRTSKNVSWDLKKEVIDQVMSDIMIIGYTDTLIEVDTLFALINKTKLEKYRRRDSK